MDQITICNSALTRIGCARISSIDEQTKSAIALKAIYGLTRDSLFRCHPWNFTIKRAVLAPVSGTPAYEFDYAYTLPSDCLRVLDPDSTYIDFVVENGQLLCNESSLNLRYIYRNEDESSWDAAFAEVMSWKLARDIGYHMTQSQSLVEACDKAYRAALQEARSMDGAEGVMKGIEATDWLDIRR